MIICKMKQQNNTQKSKNKPQKVSYVKVRGGWLERLILAILAAEVGGLTCLALFNLLK